MFNNKNQDVIKMTYFETFGNVIFCEIMENYCKFGKIMEKPVTSKT